MNRLVAVAAALVVLSGCITSQMVVSKKTKTGGTALVTSGDSKGQSRAAVAAYMATECPRGYEIVERASVPYGSAAMASTSYGITTGVSSPMMAESYTFECVDGAGFPAPVPLQKTSSATGVGARCYTTTDCSPGLTCVPQEGKDYGYCVGGSPAK